MGYRNYANSVGFIVDPNGLGDFTTIAAALTAANSGTTIFVRPGTYTENPALKAGVNLTSFASNSYDDQVVIYGKCTLSSAGTVSISGITLRTNSDYCLEVTGSANSVIYIENCNFDLTTNAGIHSTTTGSSASITLDFCEYFQHSTYPLFAFTGAASLTINEISSNEGAISTASTFASSGTLDIYGSTIGEPITTSGTGSFSARNTYIQATNATTTLGSSGSIQNIVFCEILGGTSSALTINNTTQVVMTIITSSNTNAITGSGTLNAGLITFTGTSSTINTTTVNKLTTYGGTIV